MSTKVADEISRIEERVAKAITALRIEEMMMLKQEEKEIQKILNNRLLDLELFSYEPYQVTKERYRKEFSKFCATETEYIKDICSIFREKNNLNR